MRKNLILKTMMVISTLALSIGGSLSFYYIDQEISAEAVQIDDGPLGEKIVDIGMSSLSSCYASAFAITDNGEVYAFGDNRYGDLGIGTQISINYSEKPQKVLNFEGNTDEKKYLNNIKRVFGNNRGSGVFAYSYDNTLYAWGDNLKGTLGLPEKKIYTRPQIVMRDVKIKNMSISDTRSYLLTEDGDVYVTGSGCLGLGETINELFGFKKIEFDNDGVRLEKMKDIHATSRNQYFAAESGELYVSGTDSLNLSFGLDNKKIYKPTKTIYKDGTLVNNFEKFVIAPSIGGLIFQTNENEYISSYGFNEQMGSPGYYQFSSLTAAYEKDGAFNNIFNMMNNLYYYNANNGGKIYIGKDKKLYRINFPNINNYGWYGQNSNSSKFLESPLPEDYSGAAKVLSAGDDSEFVVILSKKGGLFYGGHYMAGGKKIQFGDIQLSAYKVSDDSVYENSEKFNANVKMIVTDTNDAIISYDETDLVINDKNRNIELNDNEHVTDLQDDVRYFKKYDYHANYNNNQYNLSFIVDLFKSTPNIGNYSPIIKNYISIGDSISLSVPSDQSGWNSYTATITNPSGTTTNYNGESIDGASTYTLHVTDEYGNTADYQFEVTTNPIPSFDFQPQHSSIVYSGTGSRANDTLGNITLSYDENITPNIKTIQFVSGGDENKFTLENDGTLKVGNADLDAGTYTLNITGTDGNNMPFNGTISVVVEKAEQPDYKIVTGTKGEEVYSFIFQNNDTIQIGTKGKLSSGSEILTITSGNGTIASLQGTSPETFKMLTKGKFTVEATATGDTNYKEKTVTQEITLSDLPTQDPLVITGDDTITYGDNNNTYLLTATGGSTGNPIQWSIDSDTGLNGEASGTNATISGNLVTFNHVGKFTLKATMNGNGSYQDVSATKTITVNKMTVTVTPNPVSKYEGQSFNKVKLKGVSYSPSPLSGDDIGTPAITSKYLDSQAAGIYNDGLEVTGLSNDNYTFQYQTGTLTILDVTLPDNGDQEKSPYYEITGTKGKNGWYTSDIQIKTTGKDGYTKISQTNTNFTGDTITVSSEGETDISLYFQNTDGTITKPITYKAKIDKIAPSIPTMTVDEINTSRIARLLNMLSFGSWMNKEAQVTMLSNDGISGIDHYEYIETIKGSDSQPKSSAGTINYGDETELTLKARACDKAGNCSTYSISEELKIDKKGPTILGVKDQSVYKQYYSPRFVTVTDLVSGLKQATYKKDGNPAGAFADNVETPIKGEGSYEIYAIDEAGNEITITFKILKLPNIDTEIDGSDESRDLIDQIIKEYEEIKDKIDSSEKDEYEEWIKDAEDKWESLRKKVIEHEETTSKVEGQGDTTFDPSTKLIVEEIPKDKVPVLPRNAIKTYDVRLMKGDKEILPNGDIKVYLPYTEQEAPIVYEIDTDGTITELPSQQENGYVTFITNTLKKYAISNTKQDEIKDPDDNNNGDNNGGNDNQKPTPNPDDGKDPDNSKPDPNPDDGKNPDDNNDSTDDNKVCSVGPDGKPNTSDDVCGKPNEDGDKPIVNPDGSITIPDGGSVIFPDGSEVELPDGGTIKPDGSVELPDGTEYDKDGNKKDPDKKQCDIKGKYLNIDSDGDGRPDVNLDINGDCYPDINIDTDNDGYPNVNIDTTGDGKPNINVDTNNDGKADINIVLKLPAWKPELNTTVDGFAYDTMGGIEPDLNIDTSGDGKPNINVDTDGDGNPDQNVEDDWYEKRGITNNTNVKGNYTNKDANTGGVSTGDNTKWYIWLFLMFCTLSTMVYNYYRKHKQK